MVQSNPNFAAMVAGDFDDFAALCHPDLIYTHSTAVTDTLDSYLAKCRDGFCPVGPWIVPRDAVPAPDALVIRAWVNGELRMENTTANLQRDIAALIADVTEFMTLRAGDLLAVGVPEHPPLARAGDEVTVEVEGLGRLESTLVPEEILSGEILP